MCNVNLNIAKKYDDYVDQFFARLSIRIYCIHPDVGVAVILLWKLISPKMLEEVA
jgi:hypothetical protein